MLGQERGQVLLPGLGQDGQVAAVDHPHAQRAGGHHQAAEVRVQLGRAAGQVQRLDAARSRSTSSTRSMVSPSIISVRFGPALTWQCRQLWLHL